MRTQVAIIGAGPAGLLLSQLLRRAGIEAVVLERRSREYCEQRIRAGVLEQGTVELLEKAGVGERLHREGLVHRGVNFRFDGQTHRIDLSALAGGSGVTVYGQTEVVKDLFDAHDADGAEIQFEVDEVSLHDLHGDTPRVRYTRGGERLELTCDFVAGCDGFHGVCRASIPANALHCFQRDYPYAWLGILADVAPSSAEIIYASHERGFALLSMRSMRLSRLYLQCDPEEDIGNWPDDRIWQELQVRLGTRDGWELRTGPVLEKGITPMRSFVAEPMQYGRLYLAGDAAHIVPPAGAKGLNLAVSDVGVLSEAFIRRYRGGSAAELEAYSSTCLRRVWRAQHFSWWMTTMLHRDPHSDPFMRRLQLSQLRYLFSSRDAAASLAENYTGRAPA